MHPGCVYTNIWIIPNGNIPFVFTYISKIFDILAYYLMRTPEEGVQDIVMLTTVKITEKNNGKYFMCLTSYTPSTIVSNDNLSKEFWNNSENVINKFI